MLKIYFGRLEGVIKYPGRYFNNIFKPEWFDDPFVKEICKHIDNMDVVSAYQMTSPNFGPANCTMLSTGCKNVIMAYKTDFILNATQMGDNCGPDLCRIAEKKDVTVMLQHVFRFKGIPNFKALILNDGKVVEEYLDYLEEAAEYL